MATAGAELRRIARELRTVPRKTIDDAVKVITKASKKTLVADTGGDSSLSGAPSKLKVKSKIHGSGSVVEAEIVPGPTQSRAQWFWLEYGTNLHTIRKNQTILSPPRRTWSRAIDPAVKAIQKDFDIRINRILR